MKHNRLDKELKQKAIESIEKDLEYWKDDENYENRKKELDKLRSKLEEYECEE